MGHGRRLPDDVADMKGRTMKAFVAALCVLALAMSAALADSSNFGNAPQSAITRANNTTTYTANTGWNTATSAATAVFKFAGACRAPGSAILIPEIDAYSSANPTLKLTGTLFLFGATPATVISDNASFTIAAADFANAVGPLTGIQLTFANNQASGATNSSASATGTTYEAACAPGSKDLFGAFEVTNAYVPASAEVLTISLRTLGIN